MSNKRAYNFSAGPSMLPIKVIEDAAANLANYKGCGESVMEMSHRSAEFKAILEDAEKNLRDIMNIPDNYKVMFIQGGGTLQFAMVPLNLLRKSGKADYIVSGTWAKKAAKEAYYKHIKGRPLLPKVFRRENHIDEIKGIYVPFWLFDADVAADARYKATKVRTWSDSDYDYTETSYYSVDRSGNMSFVSVPVDGSSRMPDDLMESIEPYKVADAVEFQTAYLSGYLADKYDVDAQQSTDRARERMKESAQDVLRDTVKGYASVIPENTNVRISGGDAKYALYPVWILNTTWRGKKYIFAMNGQTGRMTGDLPVDNGAYTRWLLGLTAVFSIAAYLVALLIH